MGFHGSRKRYQHQLWVVIKVVPEIVERVIDEVEGVACTVVQPRKSTIMGQLVEALIAT